MVLTSTNSELAPQVVEDNTQGTVVLSCFLDLAATHALEPIVYRFEQPGRGTLETKIIGHSYRKGEAVPKWRHYSCTIRKITNEGDIRFL
jgi:hypothetical protein